MRSVSPENGRSELVQEVFSQLCLAFDTPDLHIDEIEGVPTHVGLGSKTSLSMAIGHALVKITGSKKTNIEIADLARRGGTSGVGVHIANMGGIVIDAGHKYPRDKRQFGPSSQALAPPPDLHSAYSSPAGWRVIHLRTDGVGLHGEQEAEFFRIHCPVSPAETEAILCSVESVLIPALRAGDISGLNRFLGQLQDLGLKRAEWASQRPAAQELRHKWTEYRTTNVELAPLCLSSMGPTLFLITDHPRKELAALSSLGINESITTVTRIATSGVELSTKMRRQSNDG